MSSAPSQHVVDLPKGIDTDALKFIENYILTDPHQDLLFKGWAPIFFIDQKVKARLLTLTNFRLSVIKNGFAGLSLRQTFLLLNLRSIAYIPPNSQSVNGFSQLVLTFAKDEQQGPFSLQQTQSGEFILHVPEKKVNEILWPLLFSAQSIRHGRPPIDTSRVPPELLVGYQKPMPDEQDGLLAAYLAECDRCGTPRRFGVIDHFLACFQYQDHTLNLSHALKLLDVKDLTKDILAIISAIKFFPWFSTILSFGLPLRDSLLAIATLFEAHSSLQTLILCHAKVTQKGLQALSTALSTGNHQLHTVSLSDCDLDDQGVITICEGLAQSKHHTIQELCLAGTGFSAKGVKALVKLFNIASFASTLRVLDISRNKLGKQGTEAFNQILSPSSPTYQQIRLEALQIDNTDLDAEKFLSSLKHSQIHDTCLQSIDLSSNKFSKSAISTLASIISQSRTLYSVTLNSAGLEAKQIIELITAARGNQHGVEFALGFANNNLGPRGAKEFEVFYTMKAMTRDEIVSRNSIMNKQTSEYATSLQGHQFYFEATPPGGKDDTQNNFSIHPSDNGNYIPLDSIDLSDNNLGNDGIVYVCRAFQVIRIRSLAIDRNFKVSTFFSKAPEAQVALERFILESSTLEEFSIAGDDKSYYLGIYLTGLLKALAATKLKLRYLDISGNRSGDHAMMALSQYILNNGAFESLILDDNRIGPDGFNSLCVAIKTAQHDFNIQLPLHDFDRLLKDRNYSSQHAQIQANWAEMNAVLDQRDADRAECPPPEPNSPPPLAPPLPAPIPTTTTTTTPAFNAVASPQAISVQTPSPMSPGLPILGQKTKVPPPPTLTHPIQPTSAPQPIQVKSTAALQGIQLTGTEGPSAGAAASPEGVPTSADLGAVGPPAGYTPGRRPTMQGRRASIIQQRTARFQLGGGSQADILNAHTSAAQRQAQARNLDFHQNELENFDYQQQQQEAQQPVPTPSSPSMMPQSPEPASVLPVHGYQPPPQHIQPQSAYPGVGVPAMSNSSSQYASPQSAGVQTPPLSPPLSPPPPQFQTPPLSPPPPQFPPGYAPPPSSVAPGAPVGQVKRVVTIHRAPPK